MEKTLRNDSIPSLLLVRGYAAHNAQGRRGSRAGIVCPAGTIPLNADLKIEA